MILDLISFGVGVAVGTPTGAAAIGAYLKLKAPTVVAAVNSAVATVKADVATAKSDIAKL